MKLPTAPMLNKELTTKTGQAVIMFEVLPISEGDVLRVKFISQSGLRRQGLWLGVDGELEVADVKADQMVIWMDTAPPEFDIKVLATKDGLLRLYNVWDSRRGFGRRSQGVDSGMLKEEHKGTITYRCNDVECPPTFDRLVFELARKAVNR